MRFDKTGVIKVIRPYLVAASDVVDKSCSFIGNRSDVDLRHIPKISASSPFVSHASLQKNTTKEYSVVSIRLQRQ